MTDLEEGYELVMKFSEGALQRDDKVELRMAIVILQSQLRETTKRYREESEKVVGLY